MTNNYTVTAEELKSFIERAEQLASEKKDVADQEKELFRKLSNMSLFLREIA